MGIRGELFVITAPSGAGKTTLCRRLVGADPELSFSVSYTTRGARAGEIAGKHYHFVDRARFRARVEEGLFLEWAEVHGELYGTDAEQTDRILASGADLLLDIDVQGAEQVRRRQGGAQTIFVMPPSKQVLEQRLRERRTDSPAQIERRLEVARREMERYAEFDYLVVNRDLDEALAELGGILRAARTRTARRVEWGREILATFAD